MNKTLEQKLQTANDIMAKDGETTSKSNERILLAWDKELWGKNTPLPPELIKGYIHRGEVSLLAGASKMSLS